MPMEFGAVYWMCLLLATAVGLGAIGAVLLILVALWLWLISPPRRQ